MRSQVPAFLFLMFAASAGAQIPASIEFRVPKAPTVAVGDSTVLSGGNADRRGSVLVGAQTAAEASAAARRYADRLRIETMGAGGATVSGPTQERDSALTPGRRSLVVCVLLVGVTLAAYGRITFDPLGLIGLDFDRK